MKKVLMGMAALPLLGGVAIAAIFLDKIRDVDPYAMPAAVAADDDLEEIVGGIPQRHRWAVVGRHVGSIIATGAGPDIKNAGAVVPPTGSGASLPRAIELLADGL